jgi:hypothetical protein
MYVDAAVRHGRLVNTSLENTDQAAYFEYAVNIHENGAAHTGNRNQMPLYPFLQSLVYDPELTVEDSFARGKAFNIGLSVVLLAGVFLLWRMSFPPIQTVALLLVTAFTVFLFRAAYIQGELFYYVLAFGTFLLFCRLLEAPSWGLAAVTGLSVAVTHLTKASVLPALLLFIAIAGSRVCWLVLRASGKEAAERRATQRAAVRQAAMVAVVPAVFLLVASPYLITSARVYGSAFYNVNSTFYMWYDGWADARSGSIRAGDRFGWPGLPDDSLPSPVRYVREHTPGQIAARFVDGLRILFGRSVETYGYWKYVVFYGLAALVAALVERRRALEHIVEQPFAIAFVLAYLASYALLYAWYIPVAAGNRLVLGLFLPYMYASARVLQVTGEADPGGRRYSTLFTAVHVAMIAGVVLELHEILTERIETVYGGG